MARRYLQIVICIAVFNAVLVAASLVHRHLGAEEPTAVIMQQSGTGELAITTSQSETADLTPQERLRQLAPPVLQSNAQPVADDDPLMAEIRKQVAGQFPELNRSSATTSVVELPTNKPSASSALPSRLSAVGHLSTAAHSLLQLSSELRMSGKEAEAEKIELQVQQLQTTIREILQ